MNKEIKQNVSSAKTVDLPYTYYIFVLLIPAILNCANRGKVYLLYNQYAAKQNMLKLPFCCFRFRLVCIIVQYPLQSSLHRHLQSFDLRNRHTVTYTFHYTSCTVLTSIVVFHCGKKSSVCQKCKTAML